MRTIPARPARVDKPGRRMTALDAPRTMTATITPASITRPRRVDGRGQASARTYDATGSTASPWQTSNGGRYSSRTFPAKGEALAVTEYHFQPDGGEPPTHLAPYVAQWLWDSTLPIVLSCVHVDGCEVAWTLTAESARLRKLCGKRAQAGVYAVRDMSAGTLVGFLQGDHLGVFREGSETYERAAQGALAGFESSYLFTTRRPGGLVDMWDGRGDRLGGMSRVNDCRGLGARANLTAATDMPERDFSEDGVLRAACKVRRVSAAQPIEGWRRRELFFSYDADYWRRHDARPSASCCSGDEQ